MKLKRTLAYQILTVCLLAFAQTSVAHEGHDHAPGETESGLPSGPISISAQARDNLKIATHSAALETIEETLTALGQIVPIPRFEAAIASRISGRISALFVSDGESVVKDQPLVEVESRQLGNPPPKVVYRAPFAGVVVDRHAVLGDTVDPDKHLMAVVNLSEVYAEGSVFEGQIAKLKIGQLARVSLEAFPEMRFAGKVDLISGALEPETRTLRVWVRLGNAPQVLRPNMRATLHIVVGESANAIAVPKQAVLGDGGERFVFVESSDDSLTFERRPVVLGASDDRLQEIIEGVFPGDKVVTVGAYQLQYVAPKKVKPD